MPRARHFCSLQCWQRLRLVRSIRQFLCREHEYMALFCWLRRKKPCKQKQTWWAHPTKHYSRRGASTLSKDQLFLFLNQLLMNAAHLAAFTGDDTIVNPWWFVPTDFTGNHFYLSCREREECRKRRNYEIHIHRYRFIRINMTITDRWYNLYKVHIKDKT